MKLIYYKTILALALLSVLFSCRKDNFLMETQGTLTFSTDSILFDTVFTTVGSTTQQLKIYNPYNKPIKISSITLAGGNASNYRINIDGVSATELKDIELKAKDSIFIFIKVTVDPNNINTPFVVSDSLLFVTNNQLQQVKLVAWGQNAYYHTPTHFPSNMSAYSVVSSNETWPNDKPHLVYGWVVVDSSFTLTIQEGTKIYFHNNSGLWVYNDASLNVTGTKENPAVFQGDRLEQWYKDMPGQWGRLESDGYLFSMGIWLSAGSKDNDINYAVIRNGDTGIKVDTLGNSVNPTLKLSNTIIENMSTAGIYAQGSFVEAENVVVSNAGVHAVILSIGGSYDFKHCTFANYWNYSSRQTSSLVLNNYYKDINENIQIRDLTKADFSNCIIYGNVDEELFLDKNSSGVFNYKFTNCLLKTAQDINNATFYTNCLKNSDPLFENTTYNNFKLQIGSPALNIGDVNVAQDVPFDIIGNSRTIQPDLGAYEK